MSTKKPTRTTATVEVTSTARARTLSLRHANLTSEEERVLRARRGVGAPLDEPLGLKHTETDKARAALMAIEREMVMKMQRRVSAESVKKSKIVDTLRNAKKR